MFERPSLQTVVDRILSDIKSRITGASTFTRRSVIRILGRVYAGAIHSLYGFLNYMADQLFVSTADSEYIDIHANEFGIIKKAATYATGSGIATGTNGIEIPASTQLRSTSGNLYETDDVATIASGTASISFTAVVAGSDSNDEASITLTFVSPISGISTSFTVGTNGITGGLDEETYEELQARVLDRKQSAPFGGTENDYETWALEVSGVTRAWCFPSWQGPGTVGVAFVRDNDENTIIPNDTQRTEVEEYIDSHEHPITGVTVGRPATAALYIISLSEYTLDFDISIYPNTSSVQASVISQLEDLILTSGPGQEITLSQIRATISSATGEVKNTLNSPIADISPPTNKVPVMGTVTFRDY